MITRFYLEAKYAVVKKMHRQFWQRNAANTSSEESCKFAQSDYYNSTDLRNPVVFFEAGAEDEIHFWRRTQTNRNHDCRRVVFQRRRFRTADGNFKEASAAYSWLKHSQPGSD